MIGTALRRTGATATFDPKTAISWKAAAWASDPTWSNPGDGNPVGSWDNFGSEGAAFTASGTARPTYKASAVNGQPGCQFSSPTFMATTNNMATVAPLSFVVICQATSLATGGYMMSMDASGAVNGGPYTDTTGNPFAFYVDPSGFASSVTSDTNAHLVRALVTAAGTSSKLSIDGGTASTGTVGARDLNGKKLGLGAYRSGIAHYAGYICFAGIYAGDITTDGQWSSFKSWVSTTYGITVA